MSRGDTSLPLARFLALKDTGWQRVTGHIAPTSAVGSQQKALTPMCSLGLLGALYRAGLVLCGGATSPLHRHRLSAAVPWPSPCCWMTSSEVPGKKTEFMPITEDTPVQASVPATPSQTPKGKGQQNHPLCQHLKHSSEERHLCMTSIARCLQQTGLKAVEMFPTNNLKQRHLCPPISPTCSLLQLNQGWSTTYVKGSTGDHLCIHT